MVVLAIASSMCRHAWRQARITPENRDGIERIFAAALRENQFDEVERVRKNKHHLTRLSSTAVTILYSPRVIDALVASHSYLHLELLADIKVLESLQNRFGPVDNTIRRLVRDDATPLRAAIVKRYGGWEHHPYPPAEQELVEKTFQNPTWYVTAEAHYPLLMTGQDHLRTETCDKPYNAIGSDYYAHQGISTRTRCPIYLGIKTHVLALHAAITQHTEDDVFVSDLADHFRAILERSRYDKRIWENSLAYGEYPTPYAYLLYEIIADLRDLSSSAVRQATTQHGASPPGRLAQTLAATWASCTIAILRSTHNVSEQFRTAIITRHLEFLLALGWQPNEVIHAPANTPIDGIINWRDLFTDHLKNGLRNGAEEQASLDQALQSLDQGKVFIRDGLTWLRQQLTAPGP